MSAAALGNGARTAYPRDASIAEVFAERAARTPDAVAVIADSDRLSYGALDERANRLANYLRARGVRPGATVGVVCERSIELPVVLLAILKAGAAYVALDVTSPPERLAYIVEDASLSFVVADSLCDAAPFGSATVVLLREEAANIAAHEADAPRTRTGPEALAYVAYTSGSTGRPKGVKIVQRGVLRLVCGADYVEIDAADTFLSFAPVSFDASTFEIWGPLLGGARLAVAPPGTLSLEELGATLERFGVTILWLTAPLFSMMVASELQRLRGVRQLLTGGDVVSPQAAMRFLEAFPESRLIDGYGPTENTTFSCCYRIPSPKAVRDGVPIGGPIANSTAYVVDENLQLAPPGDSGELCVGGDGLASGYLNLPELTAERFVPDPFSGEPGARMYRTGDVARYRADGVLEFLGRLDHQVKISGFRVELGEIESVLRSHPAVRDAAVCAIERGGDKTLYAHVVLAAAQAVDERGVRTYLETKLPKYMLPARVEFLECLPMHSSGKVDRMRLVELATPAVPKSGGPPQQLAQGARTRTIAACWREVLGSADAPDLDENFFDAGGDSLRLIAFHARLQRELRLELGIVDLFEHCTVRKLAAFVNARVA